MKIDYIATLENIDQVCEYFRRHIMNIFFESGNANESALPNYCDTKAYQNYLLPIKKCLEFCRFLNPNCIEGNKDEVYVALGYLEDYTKIKTLDHFNVNLNYIKSTLKIVSTELQVFCSSFNNEERERINEAIHTYFENCNYSCIAMSVSAIESRLLKLMGITRPDRLPELEKMTLGNLISEYRTKEEEYHRIIPQKHKPLLELCNTYRVFSVHPKNENINTSIASSILNLSLVFLTDKDTSPENVKNK